MSFDIPHPSPPPRSLHFRLPCLYTPFINTEQFHSLTDAAGLVQKLHVRIRSPVVSPLLLCRSLPLPLARHLFCSSLCPRSTNQWQKFRLDANKPHVFNRGVKYQRKTVIQPKTWCKKQPVLQCGVESKK